MTVREAVAALKRAEKIVLGYSDNALPIDRNDALALDAYGDYLVDSISSDDGKYFEIDIAVRPLRAREA